MTDNVLEMDCMYMNHEGHKKIGAREPIFVLRAQDKCAPEAIEAWCDIAEKAGAPEAKIAHARLHAQAMREWSGSKKVPD